VLGDLFDQLQQKLGGSGSGSSDGTGSAATAYLGVRAQAAPSGTTGVVVAEVAAGSPAADAGMQAGDVITKVDDTSVAQPSELAAAVRAHAPGDSVTVTYTRNGTSATAKVRLGNVSTATTPTAPTTTPATTQAPTNA
jgi:putative serine protease PepD